MPPLQKPASLAAAGKSLSGLATPKLFTAAAPAAPPLALDEAHTDVMRLVFNFLDSGMQGYSAAAFWLL